MKEWKVMRRETKSEEWRRAGQGTEKKRERQCENKKLLQTGKRRRNQYITRRGRKVRISRLKYALKATPGN